MIVLPQSAQQIIDTLKNAGFEAYAVGGSVRDVLMKRETHGWDFTTNATPEQILTLFPDSFYDNQFGTVGIKQRPAGNPDDVEDIYEITTYRTEQGYTDKRHPDTIAWGKTIDDDLSRRDFTINAIATDGKILYDPFSGEADINAKLIRAVGNPIERFTEDALRMMRAIRIAAQLGFLIESETFAGIQQTASNIQHISGERIRDELLKILASDHAADGILLLKTSSLLDQILPELSRAFSIGQKSPKRHHIFDVGTHSVEALRHCPSTDPITRLATLLHDIGKVQTVRKTDDGIITFYNHEVVGARQARGIAARLRLSKKQTDKLITLIRWHQFTVDERQTDSAIRRFIRRTTKEYLDEMLALRIGDRLGGGARETSWRLELFKQRLEEVQHQPFSIPDLKINGHDVMTVLDCKPGPVIGDTLSYIFRLVETGVHQNEREELLAVLEGLKIKTPEEIRTLLNSIPPEED